MNEDSIVPIYYTHNTFAEGGGKIHVLNYRTGRCLCGYAPWLYNEVDLRQFKGSIAAFMSQPDPDGNICLRCKKILNKKDKTRQ